MKLRIPFYHQKTDYTCGPASLEMVFKYLGLFKSESKLAHSAHTNHDIGTAHKEMIGLATRNGFYCYVNRNSSFHEIRHFIQEERLPVIVHFIEPSDGESHYAVVSGFDNYGDIILNDPWNGRGFKMKEKNFMKRWHDPKSEYKRWIMVVSKNDFGLGKEYHPVRN